MIGGIFAIDRKFFSHLGEFDTGMVIWGGENIELSFRVSRYWVIQSIIRFVLRHSTTVLMAQDNVITTGKKDVSSIMI